MGFLIDTNVVSELRKGNKANAKVRQWFESTDESDIYLSVLTLGEIRNGVERRCWNPGCSNCS
jgi:toxin FitB